MTTPAADLGATLRAWRDRLSPTAAGLLRGHARRAQGLRREELGGLRRAPGAGTIHHPLSAGGCRPRPGAAADERRARSSVPTGRFPNNRRLTDLIKVLTLGNARFAELWASGAVGSHREDHKIIDHPGIGPIAVDCDVLSDGDADLKIVVLTAAPDTGTKPTFDSLSWPVVPTRP